MDLQPDATVGEYEIRLFQVDAAECKRDVGRMLDCVKQKCAEAEEETLGAVMFTCSGRGKQFFGEEFVDAAQFKSVFPDLPLLGFWAGGEIGPQAVAEATPADCCRVGRADLQGFTAVFGVFRAPLPKQEMRPAAAMLGDGEVASAVGKMIVQYAHNAKNLGNLAVKDGDFSDASLHYTRAIRLATVPSAEQPNVETSSLFSNRALAKLRAEAFEDAFADAERAIELWNGNVKAHYRRGQALMRLERHEEAASGLAAACEALPNEVALAELRALAEKSIERAERKRTKASET